MRKPDAWTAKRRTGDAWKPDPATNWPALPEGVPAGPAMIYEALRATAATPEKALWGQRMLWRYVAFAFLLDNYYAIDADAAPELEALLADAVRRLGEKWFQIPEGIDALHDEAFRRAGLDADA